LLSQVTNEAAKDEDRLRAAKAILIAPSPSDLQSLLSLLGSGRPSFRVGLRKQLLRTKAPLLPTALSLVKGLGEKQPGKLADLLLILGSHARTLPEARPGVLAILTAALGAGHPFEVQARAIEGLALLGDDAAITALSEARRRVGDAILRQFITADLATSARPAALPGLREALWDEDPKVRELAAEGLGRFKDTASAAQLIKGAEQEPWAMVRRAEITALGELCVPEGNTLLLRAFQRDEFEVRQAGMIGLVKCKDHRAPTILIRTLGREPEHPGMRSMAARLLGENRDRRTVPYIAEALGRLLVESQADLGLEGVVGDVATALGRIGGPQASKAIATLLADPRPAIARMGIDVLGRLCKDPTALDALKQAASRKDESIAVPAASALSHCRVTN
jgi:HEAT repeat protein